MGLCRISKTDKHKFPFQIIEDLRNEYNLWLILIMHNIFGVVKATIKKNVSHI